MPGLRVKKLRDQDGDRRAAKRGMSWNPVEGGSFEREGHGLCNAPKRSRETQG